MKVSLNLIPEGFTNNSSKIFKSKNVLSEKITSIKKGNRSRKVTKARISIEIQTEQISKQVEHSMLIDFQNRTGRKAKIEAKRNGKKRY